MAGLDWVQEHYGPMVERLVQDFGLEGVCWRVAEGSVRPFSDGSG